MRYGCLRKTAATALLVITATLAGCKSHQHRHTGPLDVPPQPLGYGSDPTWQTQERNGEASDFVIYDHEFAGDTIRLNRSGEHHVKQIAARLRAGATFPVVVEQATSSPREETQHKYPVHNDGQLDLQRREVIAQVLMAMGVEDASQRVVVGPAYAEGFESVEAERAYVRGLMNQNFFYNGAGFGGFQRGFGGVAGRAF